MDGRVVTVRGIVVKVKDVTPKDTHRKKTEDCEDTSDQHSPVPPSDLAVPQRPCRRDRGRRAQVLFILLVLIHLSFRPQKLLLCFCCVFVVFCVLFPPFSHLFFSFSHLFSPLLPPTQHRPTTSTIVNARTQQTDTEHRETEYRSEQCPRGRRQSRQVRQEARPRPRKVLLFFSAKSSRHCTSSSPNSTPPSSRPSPSSSPSICPALST